MSHAYRLSKSKVIAGWQCAKRLWLEVHEPERAVPEPGRERVFETGHAVGAIARRRFPGGVLIGHDERLDEAVAETAARLAVAGPVTLFEATFRHDDVLVRVDVLERDAAGRLRLIEVKSGTKVKPVHYIDCAVQAWVLEGCGLSPDRIELAHIDRDFVYPGGGDYRGLLTSVDLTEPVRQSLASVPRWLAEDRATLAGPLPDIRIGPQCRNPYPCDFIAFCAPADPEYPVRRLPGRGKIVWELLEDGIEDLRDVPPGRLGSELQERIRRLTVEGRSELKPEAAARLAGLGWPRYYLDFETVAFAVPVWAGTRPYEALPFQWSCHVEHDDGGLVHREWLADGDGPPMRACAETLLAALGDAGPIFTYTGYEARVLQALATRFPDLAAPLAAIAARLFDLHPLTRECYYHPAMRGSWSIKAVLPTLDADVGYEALAEIREGAAASEAFVELLRPDLDPARRAALRAGLRAYCACDTLALVRLAQTLRGERSPAPVLTSARPGR